MAGNLDRKLRLPCTHFRVLLHAANMRQGTNGFISHLKEGLLRIFLPWKIRWLRPGLNPWTWIPKASTLPLDHRSRLAIAFVHMCGEWPHVGTCRLSARTAWVKMCPSCPAQRRVPTSGSCARLGRGLQLWCVPCKLFVGITLLTRRLSVTSTTSSKVGRNCSKVSLAVGGRKLLWMLEQFQNCSCWCTPTGR